MIFLLPRTPLLIMAWESTAQQPMFPITTVFVLENSRPAVESYSFTRQCVDTANRTDQKQVKNACCRTSLIE